MSNNEKWKIRRAFNHLSHTIRSLDHMSSTDAINDLIMLTQYEMNRSNSGWFASSFRDDRDMTRDALERVSKMTLQEIWDAIR